MKKAAVFAGLFIALFLGSMVTAQARTHVSFGITVGVGPAIPYGYYYYPPYGPYYYSDYYAYPYYYDYYPSYRTYVVPRYYGNGRYRYNDSRSYRRDGNRWDSRRDGRSNSRSRSNRWRY